MVVIVQDASVWQMIGALATVGAVVAALFGPPFWEWWRRPQIGLVGTGGKGGLSLRHHMTELPGAIVTVGFTNGGRQQAQDVQVFVSIGREVEVEGLPGPAVTFGRDTLQAPIPFVHMEGGDPMQQYSVAIPWGFTRSIQLFQIIDGKLRPAHRPAELAFEIESGIHLVTLDVLGSNFKACRFFGVLRIELPEAGTEVQPTWGWAMGPERVAYEPEPLPEDLRKKARRVAS